MPYCNQPRVTENLQYKGGLQKEATLRILLSCHCRFFTSEVGVLSSFFVLGCSFRGERQMTDGGAPVSHEDMGLENEKWRSS
jgi:hypothetical protein